MKMLQTKYNNAKPHIDKIINRHKIYVRHAEDTEAYNKLLIDENARVKAHNEQLEARVAALEGVEAENSRLNARLADLERENELLRSSLTPGIT